MSKNYITCKDVQLEDYGSKESKLSHEYEYRFRLEVNISEKGQTAVDIKYDGAHKTTRVVYLNSKRLPKKITSAKVAVKRKDVPKYILDMVLNKVRTQTRII